MMLSDSVKPAMLMAHILLKIILRGIQMKRVIVFLLIVMIVGVAACSKKDNSEVLATINGDKITIDEFNKELDRIPMNMKMVVATQSGKKNYLERLIVKRLLLKEAAKENIESDKEFQDRLKDIKEQLLLEALLKKKINTAAQITDEELKRYYEKNKENFKKDKEINTRHILLKTEEDARQMLSRLQNGEDFVELAKQYSADPSAATTGGEIGFHPKGSLLPEYEKAAFSLNKVGDISGIVKTRLGYHIIKLEGVRPPSYASFDEVKEFIRQKMLQERQAELIENYINELKKSAKITINEGLLKDEGPTPVPKPETKEKTAPEEKQTTGTQKR